MATSTALPVLWKDVDAASAQGMIQIEPSDLCGRQLENVTINALKKILNKKLGANFQYLASSRCVEKILFYGEQLEGNRTLGALIPEMVTVAPRLIVVTRKQPQYPPNITIVVKTLLGEKLNVKCSPCSSVSDVKRTLAKLRHSPPDQQRLIFAGLQLVDDATLDTYGIGDHSVLNLVLCLRGGGCLPQKFADVSDNSILIPSDFSTTAPMWLVASEGLNIEGRCANKLCRAYKRMVLHNNHFNSFNLHKDLDVRCPMCRNRFVPLTCGFYNCVWKFEGVQSQSQLQIGSPWTEAFGEKYHQFDADESHGSVLWDSLLIVVKPRSLAALVQRADDVGSRAKVKLNDCAICWSAITGVGDGWPMFAECGHRFHSACEEIWVEWSKKTHGYALCPVCRQELNIR